jgi:hypothetical protein
MSKSNHIQSHSFRFYDVGAKSKFFQTVERHGWAIKFSVYKDTFILLTVVSCYTGQTLVRYFNQEHEAVKFINFITELDPAQEYLP